VSYKIKVMNEEEFVDAKYPVIIFNGEYLSPGAIFIDSCASSNFFPEIDDDLSKWFWKFTVCVGLNCQEESQVVINYSKKLRQLLTDNQKHVQKILDETCEPVEATKIFDWWVDSLFIMIQTAKNVTTSTWSGIPTIKKDQG